MRYDRQEKILELIRDHDIDTQEKLATMLRKEGFKVTQATVSRDIRKLQLTKVSTGDGRQRYVRAMGNADGMNGKYKRALRDGFVSAERAMNMLVIKTFPGLAMASAAALDALSIPEILGSIAGDDTIMCATAGENEAKSALEKIRAIVKQDKNTVS